MIWLISRVDLYLIQLFESLIVRGKCDLSQVVSYSASARPAFAVCCALMCTLDLIVHTFVQVRCVSSMQYVKIFIQQGVLVQLKQELC